MLDEKLGNWAERAVLQRDDSIQTRRVGNSTGRTFNSGRGMGNLNEDAGLADRKIKARPAEFGGTVLAGSPADFGKLIAEEIEKWGKVVKFAGAKVD